MEGEAGAGAMPARPAGSARPNRSVHQSERHLELDSRELARSPGIVRSSSNGYRRNLTGTGLKFIRSVHVVTLDPIRALIR
jgi:hypothetical protein